MVRDWLTVASRRDQIFRLRDDTRSRFARKAAISAVFLLSAPYTMMSFAIQAFIIGLAIYQGFTWTRSLDTAAGSTNSRKVFIAFIASTGYCYLFFLTAVLMKYIEGWIDFGKVRMRAKSSPEEQSTTPRQTNDPQQGEQPTKTEEHPIAKSVLNVPSPSLSTVGPQEQGTSIDSPILNLTAMLEAAARAHEASAEAERRVASEYRALIEASFSHLRH